MEFCRKILLKCRLSGLASLRHICLVTSIRCPIDLLFTETYPYYNLPPEVWSLILTYGAVIDLFNVSLCSKYFYASAHNNVGLDEKMRISKRLVGNSPVFGVLTKTRNDLKRPETTYNEQETT